MTRGRNNSQSDYWNTSGGALWLRLRPVLEQLMAPFVRAAFAQLKPETKDRILEIGCGCGERAIEMARMPGPHRQVIAQDISLPMLEAAKSDALRQGLCNVRFEHGDAQTFQFPSATHDAVFSFFGVMFFRDPLAAFRNFTRALKPGGSLVFSCWQDRAQNEWSMVPLKAAADALGLATLPPVAAPGAYSLADRGLIETLLQGCGYTDIAIVPYSCANGGITVDEAMLYAEAGALRTLVDEHPEREGMIRQAVRSAFLRRAGPGDRLWLNSAIWIVRARRGSGVRP